MGNPKITRPDTPAELYNLKDDPGEQKNVIADHPEKAESLAAELKALITNGRVRK
jgi:hypothetical protein